MSDESKKFMLDVLRREFIKFMENVSKVPGAPAQKQQAFLRFDEGHMWMQNAIVSYVEPPAAPEMSPVEPVEPLEPCVDEFVPEVPATDAA